MAKKTHQIVVRLYAEQHGWLDKVKREQRRVTDADAIDFLLWCYANGWIRPPKSVISKWEKRVGPRR